MFKSEAIAMQVHPRFWRVSRARQAAAGMYIGSTGPRELSSGEIVDNSIEGARRSTVRRDPDNGLTRDNSVSLAWRARDAGQDHGEVRQIRAEISS